MVRNIAFTNVSVVPMDSERVLANHTVIVRDGTIAALGPTARTPIPDRAEVIDGSGAHLLPGLADMHVHLSFDPDPAHLWLYLAQGVTTVRNFNAAPEHIAWRDAIARSEMDGPTILSSGPGILGLPPGEEYLGYVNGAAVAVPAALALPVALWGATRRGLSRRSLLLGTAGYVGASAVASTGAQIAKPVATSTVLPRETQTFVADEREARRAVRAQVDRGYDVLKLHAYLTAGALLAAVDEAQAYGLYTVAHLADTTTSDATRDALMSGLREVAHIEEFNHFAGIMNVPPAMDPARIAEAALLAQERGVRTGTTLVTIDTILALNEDIETTLARSEYAVVRPEVLRAWRREGRGVGQSVSWLREVGVPYYRAMTRALVEAGAPLTAGTDVGVEGIVPGASLHRELELLMSYGGLSAFEAIATATREAAAAATAMGREGRWGTVAPRNRADLILVTGNPLDNVRHLRQRTGVMVRGDWMSQVELDARVTDLVGTYDTT
ncbi:MAG: hypothetical protein AVDCRST_MAG87-2513 [uncultured Thermomicrobiales bacterium]|uniref:Amidohydrolase-related domain-containing protein n=1 Tax=uncultured Thermomicrobiales bacterium TaxID=1645740 RepID=A0A6J4VCV2_9BACT|nr:MAG: hypothetical protein AVDCRST_MAG87-2513 [uncultured Thermomicrobiales bacterium]